MIPSDEPVRLLSAVLEELDYRRLTATYSRLGRIEYSPRLLFKVVLYGCMRGIYATREIERACRENVNFMYLLEGEQPPDHNTIARFRKEHLPNAVEDLLAQMNYFTDADEMIATYGEESADELFNMGAAYYYLIENAAAAKPEPGPGAESETGSAAETEALEE